MRRREGEDLGCCRPRKGPSGGQRERVEDERTSAEDYQRAIVEEDYNVS